MRHCYLLYFFVLITKSLSAQPYSIYQSITTSDGLPSNYVFATCEDENGFLWAGTDKGLCRYDGFRWQVWNKDNGLPGNYVIKILSDKKDGCWIVIPEKGIYHFQDGKARSTGRIQVAYTSLATDKNGDLFLETVVSTPAGQALEGWLYSAGHLSKPKNIYRLAHGYPGGIRANVAENRLYAYCTVSSDLPVLEKKISATWPVKFLLLDDNRYQKNPDYTIFHISDSIIINPFYFIKTKGAKVSAVPFSSFGVPNAYAYTCVTKDGYYVWNIHTGYYFINHAMDTVFYNSASGLGTDYVNHIYEAGDGTMIISTLGEGLRLVKRNYRKVISTGNTMVRTEIPNGSHWYLLAGNSILKTNEDATALVPLGKVEDGSIHLFKTNDTLFVTSLNSLAIYKEQPNAIRLLKNIRYSSGASHTIQSGDIFLTGTYGAGLLRTNRGLDTTMVSYPLKIVERLCTIPNGFAALSYEDGVFFTDTRSQQTIQFTRKDGLLSNSSFSVCSDDDTLWVGTNGGINAIVNKKIVRCFPFAENASAERALYVFKDKREKLWVVGNSFLYQRMNAQLVKLASFPLIDKGLVITNAAYDRESDQLGVGSNQSFSIISMKVIVPDKRVVAPRLLATMLENAIMNKQDFDVPYDFNRLSFVLSPMSSSSLMQNRIYYLLEGAGDIWLEVKDSLRINFAGLRSGNYKLLAKTINADGYESKPVILTHFTVEKPFWLRWPFLIACFALTALFAFLFSRWIERTKRKKKEERLLMLQSVQKERERISKDLHDHLGSNLAIIIAQTDNIESKMLTGDILGASNTLQQLSSQTRDTMSVLRETVWAVQESAHDLGEFVIRLRTFLQLLYEPTSINWQVNNDVANEIVLSPTQSLHLFRITQEASQNIVKHAGATSVQYHFSREENQLRLVISDNGKGMIDTSNGQTHGIANLKARVAELGGNIVFENLNGLSITIKFPV